MGEINTRKFLLNIIINIALPILLLMKANGFLGPVFTLMVALAFPFAYGLHEFIKERKMNTYSLIGIFGIIVTAGIGFLKLDPELIAIKEGLIPLAIGIAILALEKNSRFLKKFLENMYDIKKILFALKRKRKEKELQKTLDRTLYIFVSGFFISSAANYLLTKFIIVNAGGTAEFNEQYALLTLLNFPALFIPIIASMAISLYYLSTRIEKLTGFKIEQFQIEE